MCPTKTFHAITLVLASATAGCAGEVVDESDAESPSTQVVLIVEQTASVSSAARSNAESSMNPATQSSSAVDEQLSTRSLASLWFLRFSDAREFSSALGLVTSRTDIPTGSCAMVGAEDDVAVPLRMSRVELVFAGDVQIRSGAVSASLTSRFFPNVAGVVSGVMYTLQDQEDLAVPLEKWLSIIATGSPELEPIHASTNPPAMPDGVIVDGIEIGSRGIAPETEISRNARISLAWKAENNGDAIYVDLNPSSSVGAGRMRCAFEDTGAAEIPTGVFFESVGPESTEIGIVVHRSRESAIVTEWGDVGVAYSDLAVAFRIRLAAN